MRRLLALLALAATLPVAPTAAEAPAPRPAERPAAFVPGRITLGDVAPADRLRAAYEPLAVTPESRRMLREIAAATAKPGAAAAGPEDPLRITLAVSAPDLDGDRVGDLLLVDMTLWFESYHLAGDTTLAAFSGMAGRPLWRRTWRDLPGALMYWAQVGERRPGVVVVSPVGDSPADAGYRFVGIGGSRGDVVYDVTPRAGDDRGGEVQFGGLMNAFAGGGTDILVGRVERPVSVNTSVQGITPPTVDLTQAYVLDGRDGALRPVSGRELGVGSPPAFAAVGDLDGDRRDDYAIFRRGIHELSGSIDARSVVESKKLWKNDAVPMGRFVSLPGPGDFVADKRGDLLYQTILSGKPLVEVPPVTTEMPLFHGGLAGTHAVLLDGRDGSLERRLADGTGRTYVPFRDVDRDGKTDLVSVVWTTKVRQAGLEFSLLTKAGDVRRWRREVLVDVDVPGAASALAWVDSGGDVDRDGFEEWTYEIHVGTTPLTQRKASGFLFLRSGGVIPTTDSALNGMLDGRGSDRFGGSYSGDTTSLSMREGRTGASFWRVSVTSPALAFGVLAQRGQRGRCDGVVLVGVAMTKAAKGQVWAVALDGATGRVRWSKALNGRPAAPVVRPLGGTPARCA